MFHAGSRTTIAKLIQFLEMMGGSTEIRLDQFSIETRRDVSTFGIDGWLHGEGGASYVVIDMRLSGNINMDAIQPKQLPSPTKLLEG